MFQLQRSIEKSIEVKYRERRVLENFQNLTKTAELQNVNYFKELRTGKNYLAFFETSSGLFFPHIEHIDESGKWKIVQISSLTPADTEEILWEEKENIRKSYAYDEFGRITKEVLPYDNSDMPTKEYTYNFTGTAPEVIKVSLREHGVDTVDTYYYYDDFANLVQLWYLKYIIYYF